MGRSCYARVAQATAAPGRMYSSFGAGASAGTSGMLALTRWEQRARACAARRPEYRGCIDGRSVHPVRVRSDHASAEYWRAAQERVLTMPVLAIGGAESWGEAAGHGMEPAADDVRSLLGDPVAGAGDNHGLHEMLAALTVPRPRTATDPPRHTPGGSTLPSGRAAEPPLGWDPVSPAGSRLWGSDLDRQSSGAMMQGFSA